MDLVDFSQDRYNNLVIEYAEVAKQLGLKDVTYIPISAIQGDNIVDKSVLTPWYDGKALLEFLEDIEIEGVLLSSTVASTSVALWNIRHHCQTMAMSK